MPRNIILQGDVRDMLHGLAANSVDCCVTSPPYWALRNYGLPDSIWGGSPQCQHAWGSPHAKTWNRRGNAGGGLESSCLTNPGRQQGIERPTDAGATCTSCGAWRGQLGMEPSPELFVQHLVEVFEEVRRVLKPTGICWLNMGDTFYGSGSTTYGEMGRKNYTKDGTKFNRGNRGSIQASIQPKSHPSLKPKDLCLVPQRLAIALQEAGWWVRNEVIWHKQAPMPENVEDRLSRDHEQIWFLTKEANYFFDSYAIRDPSSDDAGPRSRREVAYDSRNKRTVWLTPPNPFHGDHHASFPPGLVVPMILAGASEGGCCAECGNPRERIISKRHVAQQACLDVDTPKDKKRTGLFRYESIGWQSTCKCDAGHVPALVLDPFMGSGTTALVAKSLGRDYLGVDAKPDYVALARQRLDPAMNHAFTDFPTIDVAS